MNFSQLHEQLRLEVNRRIKREVLTAALLARKAGMRPPHISNFLRNKRRLSIPALDRLLAALELSVADLLAVPGRDRSRPLIDSVPLVSEATAMNDGPIRPSAIIERIPIPANFLAGLRAEHGARRPAGERFVAVGLTPDQARRMQPRLEPNSVVILDRHSNLPASDTPLERTVYAVRLKGHLHFCYLSYANNLFILRPHSTDFDNLRLPVPPSVAPSDLIAGRVCLTINRY